MKRIFIPLLFLISCTKPFEKHLSQLEKQKVEMQKTIDRAVSCTPEKRSLCTGVAYSEQAWEKTKNLSFDNCVVEIQKNGYQVLTERKDIERFQDFVGSTKIAQALHDLNIVLFKKEYATRVDCIHELTHIHQQSQSLKSEMAPNVRANNLKAFVAKLNLAVDAIEALEKDKKIPEAKANADKLAPYISFIREWEKMHQWLDEKDVHLFIFKNCDELKCSVTDRDIALSNLYLLKNYLPQKDREFVQKEILASISSKQLDMMKIVKKSWKKLKVSQESLSSLLRKSWAQLIGFMKNEKIKAYKVPSKPFKELEKFAIPESEFSKLELAGEKILQGNSKILQGEAFAKILPGENENSMILTAISTKSSLVHEYLHHLQMQNNPDYRKALKSSVSLRSEFDTGKISREVYEREALKANALIWLAEFEVYEKMLEFKPLISHLENVNNEELFLKYKKKLELGE